MQTDQLLAIAEKTFSDCIATLKKKNHDYSKGEDALRNFKMVEVFQLTDAQTGVLVRLCDKFARVANLLHTDSHVKDEAVTDTIDDIINYCILLKACRQEKNNNV
jgi:hypothetical protein